MATTRITGQLTRMALEGELNRKSPPRMREMVPNTPKSPWLVILTSATYRMKASTMSVMPIQLTGRIASA